jgi:hypothetical protein
MRIAADFAQAGARKPTPGLEPGTLPLTQLSQTDSCQAAHGGALGSSSVLARPPCGQARHGRRAAPFSAVTQKKEGGQEPRADART